VTAGSTIVYLDTSVVLRAVLERGLSPDEEGRIGEARFLTTSRLAHVESARALLRLRTEQRLSEAALADVAREIDSLWARCTIWEMTPGICDLAAQVAPLRPLRTLDAVHLATYLTARRRLGADISLLTVDRRLAEAAAAI
jgi:predicted nucleic acid-binding protein